MPLPIPTPISTSASLGATTDEVVPLVALSRDNEREQPPPIHDQGQENAGTAQSQPAASDGCEASQQKSPLMTVRRDTLQLIERVITLVRRRRSAKAVETFEQVRFLVEYVEFLRSKGRGREVRKDDHVSVNGPEVVVGSVLESDIRKRRELTVLRDSSSN